MVYGATSCVPFGLNDRVTGLTLVRATQGEAVPHTDKEHPGWIFSATFLADCRTSMAMPTRSERFTPRAGGARRARACSSGAWIPSMTRSEVNVAMLERFKRLPDWKKWTSVLLWSRKGQLCASAIFMVPEHAACSSAPSREGFPPAPPPAGRRRCPPSGRSSLSFWSTAQTTPPPRSRRGCFAGPAWVRVLV